MLLPRKTSKKHPRNIQEKIIELLKTNPSLTIKDLIVILKSTEGSIRHHISKLRESKRIYHHGSTKSGYWQVND